MKITESLFETLASIELADDELIDPDFAIKLYEQIVGILQNMDKFEKEEIKKTISELIKKTNDEDRIEFFRDFTESLDLKALGVKN